VEVSTERDFMAAMAKKKTILLSANPTPSAIPFLEQYLEKSAFFMAKMDGY
jgi:hypothetical protein